MTSNSLNAVAYYRTSSFSNVGTNKHSEHRQIDVVRAYAEQSGIEVVASFYDASVSGTDFVEVRPAFIRLLEFIEYNNVHTILVEDSSRFARSLAVQESGIQLLVRRGVRLFTAAGDDLTETGDPHGIEKRRMMGLFAEWEKDRLVAKLRAARDSKRASGVKVEGRKSIAEREGGTELVEQIKRLRLSDAETGKRRSLREIANILAENGHTSNTGRPLSPSVIQRLA